MNQEPVLIPHSWRTWATSTVPVTVSNDSRPLFRGLINKCCPKRKILCSVLYTQNKVVYVLIYMESWKKYKDRRLQTGGEMLWSKQARTYVVPEAEFEVLPNDTSRMVPLGFPTSASLRRIDLSILILFPSLYQLKAHMAKQPVIQWCHHGPCVLIEWWPCFNVTTFNPRLDKCNIKHSMYLLPISICNVHADFEQWHNTCCLMPSLCLSGA